jgi:hypothetical protein
MNPEHSSRRTGDSAEARSDFSAPLSRELIELLSRLGHLIQPLNHAATPPKRMASIEIARNTLLTIIEYVDSNKAAADPGIDHDELAELVALIKASESIVGRETWSELIGVKSQYQVKQDNTYQQLGVELVAFFRRQFRNFDKLIRGTRYTPIWEDAYETFLEEFAAKW